MDRASRCLVVKSGGSCKEANVRLNSATLSNYLEVLDPSKAHALADIKRVECTWTVLIGEV